MADDATIIAKDRRSAAKAVKALERAGGKCGLELSTEKTKIVQIRGPKTEENSIGKYKIEEAKYLGVLIGGRGRDIFQAENKKWIQKAEKKANEIISQIKKSFDKVIIGKAIWKMMSLPGILFGRAVIATSKTAIERLQRIENKVWRYLLGIGGYSTVEALRGEIGASLIKSRIMETMLLFIVDTLASDFNNIKELMNDSIEKKKGKWFNTVDEYRQELELSWDRMMEIDRKTVKELIKQYDTQKWKEGLERKVTMRFYRLGKLRIGYDNCYRNNGHSAFLAKARTNSLQLEEHKGRGIQNYEATCKLCGKEVEDIVHFVIKCEKLESKREHRLIDSYTQNPEEKLRKLLFENEKHQEIGRMIRNLWMLRKSMKDDLRPP